MKHLIIKPRSSRKKTTAENLLYYIEKLPDKSNVWVDLIGAHCHLSINIDDSFKSSVVLVPGNES